MDSEKSVRGKRSRAAGAAFERRVRADLESKGWFVAKFSNNVDLSLMKMVPAKSNRFFARTTGFPDFITWCRPKEKEYRAHISGVEVKSNGYLDKGEKARVRFYLDNHVFSDFVIAKKGKKRGEIAYEPAKTI